MKLRLWFSWVLFLLPALGWFFWSFILTDRSLLYSSSPIFLAFQNFWWQFANMHPVLTITYMILVGVLFGLYGVILKKLQKSDSLKVGSFILPLGIFFLFFALSNPALSYDLFNYIFDAKLVIHYHLDPHTTSSILFSGKDDWVRFMRNVFFPTTYGYMWTALSLIPFVVGLGKFLLVFISFKLFMLLGLGLLFLLQRKMGARLQSLALFFLSPLVLLETLSSGHNDIWMMLLAFASLAFLLPGKGKNSLLLVIWKVMLSFILLYASSEVKRSTALLLPVWGVLAGGLFMQFVSVPTLMKRIYTWMRMWWADLCALLLFVPLFTELSRQFNPWYLIWSLSFLPFIKSKTLKIFLICFSL